MEPDDLRLRLRAQALTADTRLDEPVAVVERLGAIQAQDYQHSLWAVGARTQTSTRADVVAAIEKGAVLRTWPMRGTIHLVPARDARWMVRLSADRTLASARRRLEQLDISERDLAASRDALAEALSGGRRLTRPAALAALESRGIATTGQRGYHLLWHAAMHGLTCIGPHEGKQPTVVLLDEWVPDGVDLDRDEGLAELAARYVCGHGAVTEKDFAWWAGLTLTDARAGLRGADDRVAVTERDGVRWWTAADRDAGVTSGIGAGATDEVLLLPGFDEYYLGYADRSHVVDGGYTNRIVPGSNGVFQPVVVDRGRIVGTWKGLAASRREDVELSLFEPNAGLDKRRAASAIARYRDFLGG